MCNYPGVRTDPGSEGTTESRSEPRTWDATVGPDGVGYLIEALPKLMLGAIGVVYGDIGTSPLYTMKESFLGPHPLTVDRLHNLDVFAECYIDNCCIPDFWRCHEGLA